MPFTRTPVGLDDKNAHTAALSRKTSGEKSLANCWGSLQLQINNNWVGTYYTNYSDPGGSHLSHCERKLVTSTIEELGGDSKGAQGSGFTAGQRLLGLNVTAMIIFAELPPCPSCVAWHNQIVSAGLPVTVKYIDELEDYWEKIPYQRHKAFTGWIEANFK